MVGAFAMSTTMAATTATTAVAAVPKWISLCGTAAPFSALAVFAAPVPTIQKIIKEKRVNAGLPLLPYSSMVVNSFVWFVYGILKLEPKVWLTNLTGGLMSLFYFFKFKQFSPKNANNLPGTVKQHNQIVSSIILMISLIGMVFSNIEAQRYIGALGVFFCIIMFASPLAALKQIFITKDAKSMIPLPFTLACLTNCFLWSVYGALEVNDFNIYFPNILGFALACVQIGLLLVYNGNGPKYSKASTEEFPI